MAPGERQKQARRRQAETELRPSLLDAAIGATKQTEPDRTRELLTALTEEALKGTVRFDRNVIKTVTAAVEAIDAVISKQLAAIMHDDEFQKLEGSWRGLHYLVSKTETGESLKLRVLNCSKRELFKDFDKATEFDQSALFKMIYETEFGSPGGAPVRRHDRRLRVREPPGRHRAAGECVRRGGGGVLPVPVRRVAPPARLPQLAGAVQAARSEDDRRFRRVHEVDVLPRQRGFPVRGADDAAHAGAAAVRQEHQADRRVRLRGGGARPEGRVDRRSARSVLLDEHGVRSGHAS